MCDMRWVSFSYPIVRRVLRPRNLVQKMTRSEIYFSLIGNGIMAFGVSFLKWKYVPWRFKLRHIPPISWAHRRTKGF